MRDISAPGGDVRSLKLTGDVDIAAAEGVFREGSRCLEGGPPALEIDLSGVTFIDSSGLGALVRIRNQAERQGATVVLVNLSRSSRRLLELSGLDQVFAIGSRD